MWYVRALGSGGIMSEIRPTKFAHVVLRTNRFRETVDWYRTVLHAWPAFENDLLAFITYDDEHHRLAFVNTPDAPDPAPGTAGIDHFAYTYETLGDLVLTYERLKGEGIVPVWTINHGPTTSLYYQDPNGNRVELQIDNFETVEALASLVPHTGVRPEPRRRGIRSGRTGRPLPGGPAPRRPAGPERARRVGDRPPGCPVGRTDGTLTPAVEVARRCMDNSPPACPSTAPWPSTVPTFLSDRI